MAVMRAATTTDTQSVVVTEAPRPTPGTGQLLLRVDAAGICGSDLHALHMLPAGVVLGHEFTGTVVETGPDTDAAVPGDRVVALPVHSCQRCAACLSGDPITCSRAAYLGTPGTAGAFAEYVVVDASAAVTVPDTVDDERAALVEPCAIGLKVFLAAQAQPWDRVLVLGAGPIGLAVAQWALLTGIADVTVSDPVESRRELALRLGATAAVDLTVLPPESVEEALGGAPPVVIECVGRPGTVDDAMRVVASEGTVVVAGIHGTREEFDRMAPFLKNVTVRFSSWYRVDHYRHTVRMIAAGRLDPLPMVTHRIALDDLASTVAALHTPRGYGKVLVLGGRG